MANKNLSLNMKTLKQILIIGLISMFAFTANATLDIKGYKARTTGGEEVYLADAQSVSDAITELRQLIASYHPTNVIPPIPTQYHIEWKLSENEPWLIGQYLENQDIILPDNPTKEGFDFIGWEPTVPTKMPAHDLVEIAQWANQTSDNGFYFDSYPRIIGRNDDSGIYRRYYLDGIHEPVEIGTSIGTNSLFGAKAYSIEDTDNYDISKGTDSMPNKAYTDGVNFRYIIFKIKDINTTIQNHNAPIANARKLIERLSIDPASDIIKLEECYQNKYSNQITNLYYKVFINSNYVSDIYCSALPERYNAIYTTKIFNQDSEEYEDTLERWSDEKDCGYALPSGSEVIESELYFDPSFISRNENLYHKIESDTYYFIEKFNLVDKTIDLSKFNHIKQYNSKLYNGSLLLNAKEYPLLYNFDSTEIKRGNDPFLYPFYLFSYYTNKYSVVFGSFYSEYFPDLELFTYPINIRYNYDYLSLIASDNWTSDGKNYDCHIDFSKSNVEILSKIKQLTFPQYDITSDSPTNSFKHNPIKAMDIVNFNYNSWIKQNNEADTLEVSYYNKFFRYPLNIYPNVTNLVLRYDREGSYNFVDRTMNQVKNMYNYPFGAALESTFICSDGSFSPNTFTVENIVFTGSNHVLRLAGSCDSTNYVKSLNNISGYNQLIIDSNNIKCLPRAIFNNNFKYMDLGALENLPAYTVKSSWMELPDTIKYVGKTEVTYVYIPRGIRYVDGFATFPRIYFEGSEDEWNQVEKGPNFNPTSLFPVQCNFTNKKEFYKEVEKYRKSVESSNYKSLYEITGLDKFKNLFDE